MGSAPAQATTRLASVPPLPMTLASLRSGLLAAETGLPPWPTWTAAPLAPPHVETLAAAGDQLLHLAPAAEPPVGFESGVFERLGLEHRAAGRRSWLGRGGPSSSD